MTTPLPSYIAPVALEELGYELISQFDETENFKFGRGTDITVSKVDFGAADADVNDVPNPRDDGMRFSRDYFRGRLITFEGNIYTKRSFPGNTTVALDVQEAMGNAWSPEELRLTPGAVTSLRMQRAGRIRRVFGRPTRFYPIPGTAKRGWIPYDASFRCVDHLFYDDIEYIQVVPLIPASIGGLQGNLIGPIIASSAGTGSRTLIARGTKPSWMTYKIYGPIVNPYIQVTDRWSATLNTVIAYDQFIVVDPTPWNRSVRRNDGANLSGVFTAQSNRLSEMRLYPGPNEVLLKGTDPTGTSRMEVFWRDTYSSY